MSLNPLYFTTITLEPYFVDKSSGAPLANGTISFYEDSSRSTPKTVYEISGSPPNYTYTALPNPITLSGVGTIQDSLGNNIALYYHPYDENEQLQLYYIVVKDQNGVVQFTREAWPNISAEDDPAQTQNNVIINQLSNPQFVDVLFNPSSSFILELPSASTYNVAIAPDWTLSVTCGSATNVTITRSALAGSLGYPTNPPYKISFDPASNISSMRLIQKLSHNPDVWSPASGGTNGWVGANIVLDDGSAVSMYYAPSQGAAQLIGSFSNTSGSPEEFSAVTQLAVAANTDNANVGYVNIVIDLNVTSTTTLTSVQVVGLVGETEGITFNQAPVNRQEDQLFHYYNPLLQAKPINSYLVGWDFPLNPAQALTSTVPTFASGANTSNYVWDQTIVFQSANSGVSFSRPASGALRVTGAANTQFALIQYLNQSVARQILNQRMSVNVSALTNVMAGVSGVVQLWYTKAAALPDMTANDSIVASLNSDGTVATFNFVTDAWIQVPRSNLGNASFKVGTSSTTEFNDYAFSGWDMSGVADVNLATFFAITVGFSQIASTNTIDFNSISLVPGDIPTRPAPKTADESLIECQYYYETSYLYGVSPGTAAQHSNALTSPQGGTLIDSSMNYNGQPYAFSVNFKTPKVSNAPTVTLYSDNSGDSDKVYAHLYWGGTIRDEEDIAITEWTAYYGGNKSIGYRPNTTEIGVVYNYGGAASPYLPQTWISYHYVCDSRLGIV